ncbi:integrase [Halobacteriales archaeon QS_4_69_34]|nr:MAG: integrase [Halobacteriales archaeon QS_4_69_34]
MATHTPNVELEEVEPETAVELYLESRRYECSQSTVSNHRYRLGHFTRWCEQGNLQQMSEMSGRKAEEYRQWRRRDGDLAPVTIEQQIRTFRVFLQYCESNEWVRPGIHEKVLVPDVSAQEKSRNDHIDADTADRVLSYLKRYHYGSTRHVLFHLLWHTGIRTGAARALDTDDWHPNEGYLSIRHRPDTETPLKLKERGERNLSIINSDLATVLTDYIRDMRPEVTDEHGREPLIASKQGRMHPTNIQRHIYVVTRPCHYGQPCPHDRDPDECEATPTRSASKCPSSVSPHPIRRSAITEHLNQDVPKEVASERMAVSVKTLEQHYDARTKEDKRELRRDYLGGI